ncbi:MAG: prepilin-type N-terminal cleavage/methylation domain-containing protein [Elusimicrobia bacterium]|nr:prepilin-type N-terminal cleavage/methylation domain-containing protein [Candidatus Obscuribacterium magneticum]
MVKSTTKRGFSLVELVISMAVLTILGAAITVAIVSFYRAGFLGGENRRMRALISDLRNSLTKDSAGSAWYEMTQDVTLPANDKKYPGLYYHLVVDDIRVNSRLASITVYRFDEHGRKVELTRTFSFNQRPGRSLGGVIHLVARADGDPVRDVYCEAPPYEGSSNVYRQTDSDGEGNLRGVAYGSITVTCDTEHQARPASYFPASTSPDLPAGTKREFPMVMVVGVNPVLNLDLKKLKGVTINVFRWPRSNPDVPIGSAKVKFERWDLNDYPGHLTSTILTTDSTYGRTAEYSFIPGTCRVTVLGLFPRRPDQTVTDIRVALDRPDWQGTEIFNVGDNSPAIQKTYFLPKRGDVYGTVSVVNFAGGKFVNSGVPVPNDVKLTFQEKWSIYNYTTGPLPHDFNYNNTVSGPLLRNTYGQANPVQVATKNGDGSYRVNQLVPLVIHPDFNNYSPDDASSLVLSWPYKQVPPTLIPIFVLGTGKTTPDQKTKENVQFIITTESWGTEVYPRIFSSISDDTNFLFPVHAAATERNDYYMLGYNAGNLLTVNVNIKKNSAPSQPFNPNPNGNEGFSCSITPYIRVESGVRFKDFAALRVDNDGSKTTIFKDPRIIVTYPTLCLNTTAFTNFVPPLFNTMYVSYSAFKTSDLDADIKLDLRVSFNRDTGGPDGIVPENRINNASDVIDPLRLRVEIQNESGNWVEKARRDPNVNGNIPTLSPPVPTLKTETYESLGYSDADSRVKDQFGQPPSPGESPAPTVNVEVLDLESDKKTKFRNAKVIVVDSSNNPVSMVIPTSNDAVGYKCILMHEDGLRDTSFSGAYYLTWDPTTSAPPVYRGRIDLRLMKKMHFYGRVQDYYGRPIRNATVTLYRDTEGNIARSSVDDAGNATHACVRTPCPNKLQYNIPNVYVPQTKNTWQWYIVCTHPAYQDTTSSYYPVYEQSNPEQSFDCVMELKPGTGY